MAVTSSDWGVTFSFSWEQSSYDSNTKDELTTINIYGKLKYNIFIEGIETVYTELKHFQVVVNNKTGKEVSGKIIYWKWKLFQPIGVSYYTQLLCAYSVYFYFTESINGFKKNKITATNKGTVAQLCLMLGLVVFLGCFKAI